MNKKELQNIVSYETDEEMLLMDGFEDAFIGFSKRCGQPTLATYSFLKMLQVLVDRDDMSFEEAFQQGTGIELVDFYSMFEEIRGIIGFAKS